MVIEISLSRPNEVDFDFNPVFARFPPGFFLFLIYSSLLPKGESVIRTSLFSIITSLHSFGGNNLLQLCAGTWTSPSQSTTSFSYFMKLTPFLSSYICTHSRRNNAGEEKGWEWDGITSISSFLTVSLV